MAERPGKLDIEVMPAVLRWLEKHPTERAAVERFASLMVEELAANNGKGNRQGWLEMDRKEALAEVHWHASKLAVAAKDAANDPGPALLAPRIRHAEAQALTREYAADVANCALMVLDVMGLLLPEPVREPTQCVSAKCKAEFHGNCVRCACLCHDEEKPPPPRVQEIGRRRRGQG